MYIYVRNSEINEIKLLVTSSEDELLTFIETKVNEEEEPWKVMV